MSDTGADESCCASCGKTEVDEVKLKKCDGGCDLARYCSDECQQENRQLHEAICKERAAELRDELLFRQPEWNHLGDCSICFIPMTPYSHQSKTLACCGKIICDGCFVELTILRSIKREQCPCPYCRQEIPRTVDEMTEMLKKRAPADDPAALLELGLRYSKVDGDNESAFKCWARAAELGNVDARFKLSRCYLQGKGVEKNKKMELYHLEEASIAGHLEARYDLGCIEMKNERFDRAVKHFIIAANLGYNKSVEELKYCYKDGHVSKDDYAAALYAYQAAVDEAKSPQREFLNCD